jgi:hypothetical protein
VTVADVLMVRGRSLPDRKASGTVCFTSTTGRRESVEPVSIISAIALPIGKAFENSIAVTEAAAVVSFRKVRRVV